MRCEGPDVSEVAVSVRDLSKRFNLYARPRDRILEWATFGYLRRHQEFWALQE
jgi:lipopolysaccharide transport system ATP-binding protein